MFNVLSVKIHSVVLDDVGQSLETQNVLIWPGAIECFNSFRHSPAPKCHRRFLVDGTFSVV